MTLFTDVNAGANFSEDRTHRYCLWRIWDVNLPLVMFIGLNPSTADESEPDNTIKRVTKISQANRYGGFYMMNCWTFVTRHPELLQHDPVFDAINNKLLRLNALVCKDVVFAWGAFKVVKEMGRDKELAEMFPNAKALFINVDGSPKHPLFCKGNTKFISYNQSIK